MTEMQSSNQTQLQPPKKEPAEVQLSIYNLLKVRLRSHTGHLKERCIILSFVVRLIFKSFIPHLPAPHMQAYNKDYCLFLAALDELSSQLAQLLKQHTKPTTNKTTSVLQNILAAASQDQQLQQQQGHPPPPPSSPPPSQRLNAYLSGHLPPPPGTILAGHSLAQHIDENLRLLPILSKEMQAFKSQSNALYTALTVSNDDDADRAVVAAYIADALDREAAIIERIASAVTMEMDPSELEVMLPVLRIRPFDPTVALSV